MKRSTVFWATATLPLVAASALAQFTISPVAGGGNPPFPSIGDGGPATSAYLSSPLGIAADATGNLYVAEARVRKITGDGIISTFGTYNSSGVAVDKDANLYVSATSSGGSVVRLTPSGTATTLMKLPAGAFGGPDGVAVDGQGNVWYSWRGAGGHVVSKLTGSTSTVVAGGGAFSAQLGDGGAATSGYLSEPRGLAVDSAGNLYIADFGNNRIRKVTPGGTISTVAGNSNRAHTGDGGPAAQAAIAGPCGVALDAAGNLYFTEYYGNTVRMIKPDGTISTVAGNGSFGSSGDNGPATSAALGSPYGITVSSGGAIYVTTTDGLVRALRPALPAPSVSTGGIAPIFSSSGTVQPGEWISIYGSNLASGISVWNGDFPVSLGGTSVTINSKPAYLWFVSPNQINLQVPDDTATGPVPVVVKTASGSVTSTVTLGPYGPSWNLLDAKHVAGIILRSDGSGAFGGGSYDIIGPTGTSLGYRTVAAKAGDSVVLFAVGFGPTTPAVPAGKAFSGSAPLQAGVPVRINNIAVSPAFAGMSGPGLYQFNITIPAGLGTGEVALQAVAGGIQTPAGVVLTLQ